ncbi:hypothetical protein ACSBR2_030348 [Camellia fascicularis]
MRECMHLQGLAVEELCILKVGFLLNMTVRLVLALGAESKVDVVPGAAEFALPFSTLEDACVDLLRGQKSDKVDVTLQPEEWEVMNNVLHAKYEEARRRRSCVVKWRISNEKKRKRKMQEKDGKLKNKDFKF